MLVRYSLFAWLIAGFTLSGSAQAFAADSAPSDTSRPNIVYILCDDLGYGDVHALNPARGKIATPNVDQFATQGMTFTDCPLRLVGLHAHAVWNSDRSVCMAHRLQSGVLQGMSPPLIAGNQLTVGRVAEEARLHDRRRSANGI